MPRKAARDTAGGTKIPSGEVLTRVVIGPSSRPLPATDPGRPRHTVAGSRGRAGIGVGILGTSDAKGQGSENAVSCFESVGVYLTRSAADGRDVHAQASMLRFEPHPAVVIGLVGGIAAGKSTVANLFAEAGLEHVDADVEARAVVEDPAVREAIRQRFGPRVFHADGGLDRAAVAHRVFGDDAARAALEAITHPAIRARIRARLASALAAGRSVLLDAALLLEGPLEDTCDAIVFVEAADEVRRARARARGWTEAEWRQREAAQLALSLKRARANATIRNDGDVSDTRRQVEQYLSRWRHPSAGVS